VLRYGNRTATLWPSRRIVPAQPTAPAAGSRLATAQVTQTVPATPQPTVGQAVPAAQAPAANAGTSVKLANMTSLYSDKLTGADHE
jgi:hypothetical protein